MSVKNIPAELIEMGIKIQKAACCSMGTKQCAPMCLVHPTVIPLGECPYIPVVWTPKAIIQEYKRRKDGPLKEFFNLPVYLVHNY
jgi:hypothetical protein